jgi:hypothetical protein
VFCKCGNKIPEVRKKAGYTTCVNCSTEDKWGCSQVVFHKTGNTIEVIKDKELCEEINAMAQRKTFGVCSGMTGTHRKKPPTKPKLVKKTEDSSVGSIYRPNIVEDDFYSLGGKAIIIQSKHGDEEAERFLEDAVKMLIITSAQKKRISTILTLITNH